MARYRVDVSEPAESDLRDIVRYISAHLSAPMTATKMMDAIEEPSLVWRICRKNALPLRTNDWRRWVIASW